MDPHSPSPVVFEQQLVEVRMVEQKAIVCPSRLHIGNTDVGSLAAQVAAVAHSANSLVELLAAVSAVDAYRTELPSQRLQHLCTQVSQVVNISGQGSVVDV